jgi:hypothetical protein
MLVEKRYSGAKAEPENAGPRPSDYAYTLYWTRQVRSWPADRRAKITSVVESVTSDPDFRPNEFYRVYTVPGLDESAHAGASLQALLSVLTAFDQSEQQGEFDD